MITLTEPFIGSIKNLTAKDLEIAVNSAEDKFCYLSFSQQELNRLEGWEVGAAQIEVRGNEFDVYVFDANHYDADVEDAMATHEFASMEEVFEFIQSIQATPFTEITWG